MKNNRTGFLPLQGKITCEKCGFEKRMSEFYACNKSSCKECVKAAVRKNREANLDYYRSYDRMRYRQCEHRKELAKKCSQSIDMSYRVEKQRQSRSGKGREKYKARISVGNALRSGKIKKASNCFFCESTKNLQAHHHDYRKPLDVFWLCSKCHGKLHVINGDFHKDVSK